MRNSHAASGSDYGSAAIPAADIIQAGYAPGSMISGTTLQSRWRSAIAVTGAGSTFLIEIPGVPQEDCIALLQPIRSEQRRVGTECLRTGRARRSPDN